MTTDLPTLANAHYESCLNMFAKKDVIAKYDNSLSTLSIKSLFIPLVFNSKIAHLNKVRNSAEIELRSLSSTVNDYEATFICASRYQEPALLHEEYDLFKEWQKTCETNAEDQDYRVRNGMSLPNYIENYHYVWHNERLGQTKSKIERLYKGLLREKSSASVERSWNECRKSYASRLGNRFGVTWERLKSISKDEYILLHKNKCKAELQQAARVSSSSYNECQSQENVGPIPLYDAKDLRYLAILGLRSDATIESIRRAYKEVASHYHPDLVPLNLAEEFRHLANCKMKDINEAKAHLLKKFGGR